MAVGLELDDLQGPFQPKQFYDSMIHLSDCHSSQQLTRNLTLSNIGQLLINKSLKADDLLLTLKSKS